MKRKKINRAKREALLLLQDGKCALSDEPIKDVDDCDVDHRVPLELGGADDRSNWQLVLKESHKAKTFGEIKGDKGAREAGDVQKIAKAKRLAGETKTGPRQAINPRAQRQIDVPLRQKSDWRSRKDARLNGESE